MWQSLHSKTCVKRPLSKRPKIGFQSRKEGKDQESMHSSTTPEPDITWESEKNTMKHHIQESQDTSHLPAGDHKATMNRLNIA